MTTPTPTPTTTAAALVAQAKAHVENLDVDAFAREAERDDAVVVDLREPEERSATGTIAGAIAIPRGMLEFRADPTSPYHDERLSPDRRVLLHCASGGRSALAARSLAELGYGSVAHLDGGMTAWVEAGRPVRNHVPPAY
ncbi:MAG: rhodanese-like domain-containing protein [Acidimicrobiia bacterium]